MIRPQNKGGFGLILVKAQFCALDAMLIMWTTTNGETTLHHIMRKKVGNLSTIQGGILDLFCLVFRHATKPKNESMVWTNLCIGYNFLKKLLSLKTQRIDMRRDKSHCELPTISTRITRRLGIQCRKKRGSRKRTCSPWEISSTQKADCGNGMAFPSETSQVLLRNK